MKILPDFESAARHSKEASSGAVQTSRRGRMYRLGGCSRRGHIRPENGTGAMNRRAGVALRLQQWPRTYLRGAMRG